MSDARPRLQDIAALIDISSPEATIQHLCHHYPGEVVFSTSFGLEDQVITDIIAGIGVDVEIFTLDTGRLFPETYSTWEATLSRYGIRIDAGVPDSGELHAYLQSNGPNAFYEAVEKRRECCHIRKVAPLRRMLAGRNIWITGLRKAQSGERKDVQMAEWDEGNQIVKYHPLLYWTTEDLKQRIRERNIPYNPLHDKGFPSIGCAPCTRAIREGEEERAGRWWWENNQKKECGLHSN